MTSISSANINELLPGLEDFLRTMSNSTCLDSHQRQVAHMYLDKLTNQSTDDFTDEDEEDNQQQQQQFYIDTPKSDENNHHKKRSNILADGHLLTYDQNHNWLSRYYLLDNYDLICYSSDNHLSPLWVSDMTNAKIQMTTIDHFECLCLQIDLAEAIYLRSEDPNQMNIWLKAFGEVSLTQKSKTHRHTKTFSRIFAQLNRRKGQFVSHFLNNKSRKHYELRGFLVISFDNSIFSTKYCTIVDGYFRIHKSRLNDQIDRLYDLTKCTLAFPEERTRDIQFALIEQQSNEKIFIRGNHIYTMGRLLNTLAKYVEIQGSLQSVFEIEEKKTEDFDKPPLPPPPPPLPLPRRSTQTYDIPITIEKSRKFSDEETIYDNISNSDGIGQFRFMIPFNHSSQSAFRRIERHRSPSSSSLSSSNSTLPQTSSSSFSSNYSHQRSRLMTAV